MESTLTLKVIRAVELPAKDFMSGTSDPYVKIMLLPEKRSKMSTSIKRRNLNPRWNEIFAFEGNFRTLLSSPARRSGNCFGGIMTIVLLYVYVQGGPKKPDHF